MAKLGSLFDGAGTFPYAAQLAGMRPLWSSEIAPFPRLVTAKRLPDVVQLGDVTQVRGDRIAPVDVITFGSPCQDLSVAGRRAGLAGARSGLFREAIRIIPRPYRRGRRPLARDLAGMGGMRRYQAQDGQTGEKVADAPAQRFRRVRDVGQRHRPAVRALRLGRHRQGVGGKMKQYCRYCAYCGLIGDELCYCDPQNRVMSGSAAKRVNRCADFAFNETDVFDAGRRYRPRGNRPAPGQLAFGELPGAES